MTNKTGFTKEYYLKRIGLSNGKYYEWKKRMGIENKHNSNLPKSNWVTPMEQSVIIEYATKHYAHNSYYVKDGYRRLTYRMIDEDIVAVSPSSVYRILKTAGLLNRWNTKKQKGKGTGFTQPTKPHQHWHIDIKYVNFNGTFLFLISVLDGYSRYVLHHGLRLSMTEFDVELVIEQTKEKFPGYHPRIISDNGPQFISKDFHLYMKIVEFEHVRTSVNYPQSNGKIERFHGSINRECLNTNSFVDYEHAQNTIAKYIDYYNKERLHSALFYLTPEDFLVERVAEKLKVRQNKLNKATDDRIRYWQNQNRKAA